MSELSNLNEIGLYLHCKLCVEESMNIEGESPESYSHYSVGWTPPGLQIWCQRHNCNIAHIDFEGHQHPANIERFNNKLKVVK